MYHLLELNEDASRKIQQSLAQLRGVREVLVLANGQIARIQGGDQQVQRRSG